MITKVRAKNFKSFSEIDIDLKRLNVLVGRNGSGKSAFLDILHFVSDALRTSLETAIGNRQGITALRRWAPRKLHQIEIALTVEASQLWGEYSFVIASGKQGNYRRSRESCRVGTVPYQVDDKYEIDGDEWITVPERLTEGPDRKNRLVESDILFLSNMAIFSPLFSKLHRHLTGSFYTISPHTLRVPQKPSNEKLLLEHGDNLASIIKRLEQNKVRRARLLKSLARVVDGISDLRVKAVGGYLVTELEHKDITPSANQSSSAWFDLNQESDGTLRLLGMLAALYQDHPGHNLIAIEEPENVLHPGALAVLSDVIYEASRRNQILVTTQSPDLISRFKADDLLVVDRVDGISQIGPISEIQRDTIEEQLFTSGDLLRIEGLRRESTSLSGARNA